MSQIIVLENKQQGQDLGLGRNSGLSSSDVIQAAWQGGFSRGRGRSRPAARPRVGLRAEGQGDETFNKKGQQLVEGRRQCRGATQGSTWHTGNLRGASTRDRL